MVIQPRSISGFAVSDPRRFCQRQFISKSTCLLSSLHPQSLFAPIVSSFFSRNFFHPFSHLEVFLAFSFFILYMLSSLQSEFWRNASVENHFRVRMFVFCLHNLSAFFSYYVSFLSHIFAKYSLCALFLNYIVAIFKFSFVSSSYSFVVQWTSIYC